MLFMHSKYLSPFVFSYINQEPGIGILGKTMVVKTGICLQF